VRVERAPEPGERILLVARPGQFDELIPPLRYALLRAGAVDLGVIDVIEEPHPEDWDPDLLAEGTAAARAVYREMLRGIGAREVVSCMVPAGYAGSEGEIWFARVLPPPHALCRRHIVLTTPYVIRDWPESAFVDYLERELARMKARKRPPRTDDLDGHLMKYGPEPNHWNEYVFCAYTGHRKEAIFLTGIPDIPESLPHASGNR